MKDMCEVRCIHAEQVARVAAERSGDHVLEDAAALLGVLAEPTRLKIVDALRLGELCVCDLAVVLGMSVSAISHQLRLLRASRLVRGRRAGKMVLYSLYDAHVEKLLHMALEHCQGRCEA
jgi:DNA-binding transcriptional ArsR family regulator